MAMENGTLSASDVALLSGNNGMWGDGSFMWIFALLILAGGGFNGFGWGNGFGYQPQYATQDFVQNGFNFNNLLDQNRDILNAISKDTADTITAIKDGNAATIREFGNVESALATAIQQQQTCCCEVQRNIDAVNYNAALNTASINANTTAQTQKILDAINSNRMADMQNQINELQLANATSNVLRYPNSWTYNAGMSPFCSGGCNCGM
jgi:hypothetical protein